MPDPNLTQTPSLAPPAGILAASPRQATGVVYNVAKTLNDVTAAWRMVYMAYRRTGLIEVNPHRIHTAPQAIGPHAAVIGASIGPLTVSTLTAFADNSMGLPLDRVYGNELQSLRRAGRTLMEVGLFADRRTELNRTAEALFQLMRHAFYYALELKVTDFVIGVHPRHARFYTRAFGFEPMGSPKTYPAVNNRPVVLLRGDLDDRLKLQPLHPALNYFVNNPIPADSFADRFSFDERQLADSDIEAFLNDLKTRGSMSQSA